MIVRGAFNHLVRPGLRRDFRDSYQAHREEFSQYLRVGTQDRAEVEVVAISGLPRMVKRGEAEPVTFLDPQISDKKTFIDDEFALGFWVSKRMMEDDLYNRANQNSKWLARSARLTQEYQSAALLDDAFDGVIFKGLSDEVLISATHTLIGAGGTWSNRIAGDTQLGITGLQAAFELGERQVDHNGDPIPAMLTTLIVKPSEEAIAIKVINSPLEPFTTDNQVNFVRTKRQGLNYILVHYPINNRQWFMVDPNLSDAHFLFRVRPEFEDDFDFKTKAALFTGRQRVNVYFFDQRGWIGSKTV